MTRRVALRQSLPWCREVPPEKKNKRQRVHQSVVATQCYISISMFRDLLGETRDPRGYKRALRIVRRAGADINIGGRVFIARDTLGSTFPQAALRLAQCEVLDDLCE